MKLVRTLLVYGFILLTVSGAWHLLARPRHVDTPGLRAGEKLQCVSYAPFRKKQSPFDLDRGLKISPTDIESDLAVLAKHFDCVRTYSVGGLEAVPAIAQRMGLKILLGAWVSADPIATRRELSGVIALAKQYPSAVRAVVVGNEALLRKEVTGRQLAGYISEVKQALPTVAITYADVWEFWLKHPDVAPTTDFITIHILPYWEDKPTAIGDALAHVKKVRLDVAKKIPGKDILIGETGWPSTGRMRAGALPSIENQARFIRGFVRLAKQEGWQYNLIEAFDQPWKRINEGTVGGAWGLFDTNRQDKGVLDGDVIVHPNSRPMALLTAAIALLTWPIVWRRDTITPSRRVAIALIVPAWALALALQFEQFSLSARSGFEYGWAGLVLLLSGACYVLTVRAIATGQNRPLESLSTLLETPIRRAPLTPARLTTHVRTGLLLCSVAETLGLVFDARYRSFNNFAFILPALAYAITFKAGNRTESGRTMERSIALLLAAGALFVVYNETLLNLQADIWAVTCLIFAYPLWRDSRGSALKNVPAALFACILAYALTAGLRYGVMESTELVTRCAQVPTDRICSVRTTVGIMIHFGVFGWLSLIAAGLALLTGRSKLRMLSLILCTVGLILYNTNLSIVACIVLIVAFGRRSNTSRKPVEAHGPSLTSDA